MVISQQSIIYPSLHYKRDVLDLSLNAGCQELVAPHPKHAKNNGMRIMLLTCI